MQCLKNNEKGKIDQFIEKSFNSYLADSITKDRELNIPKFLLPYVKRNFFSGNQFEFQIEKLNLLHAILRTIDVGSCVNFMKCIKKFVDGIQNSQAKNKSMENQDNSNEQFAKVLPNECNACYLISALQSLYDSPKLRKQVSYYASPSGKDDADRMAVEYIIGLVDVGPYIVASTDRVTTTISPPE